MESLGLNSRTLLMLSQACYRNSQTISKKDTCTVTGISRKAGGSWEEESKDTT